MKMSTEPLFSSSPPASKPVRSHRAPGTIGPLLIRLSLHLPPVGTPFPRSVWLPAQHAVIFLRGLLHSSISESPAVIDLAPPALMYSYHHRSAWFKSICSRLLIRSLCNIACRQGGFGLAHGPDVPDGSSLNGVHSFTAVLFSLALVSVCPLVQANSRSPLVATLILDNTMLTAGAQSLTFVSHARAHGRGGGVMWLLLRNVTATAAHALLVMSMESILQLFVSRAARAPFSFSGLRISSFLARFSCSLQERCSAVFIAFRCVPDFVSERYLDL